MARCLALCMLSLATAVAADDLDRAIALFKDGDVVQAIGTLNTLTTSEDAAVFHADIMLRVFDNRDRAVELLEAWEGTERVGRPTGSAPGLVRCRRVEAELRTVPLFRRHR